MSKTTTAKSPTSRHAHFSVNVSQETKKNEKILTIRYGKNQMALIRKRLRVEAWLYDSLELLAQEQQQQRQKEKDLVERVRTGESSQPYTGDTAPILAQVEDGGLARNPESAEIDIDIDQILDVEGDCERRQWLQEKLKDSRATDESIQKFINEFLDRLKTL